MSAFPSRHLAALLTLLFGYFGGTHLSYLIRGLHSLLFDAICIVFLFNEFDKSEFVFSHWTFYWFYTLKDLFHWVCLRM